MLTEEPTQQSDNEEDQQEDISFEDLLKANRITSTLLSFVSKEERGTLRLTSKSTSKSIALRFFSESQYDKERHQLLKWLSGTTIPLPANPLRLLSALNTNDSWSTHIAALIRLLETLQLDCSVDQAIIDELIKDRWPLNVIPTFQYELLVSLAPLLTSKQSLDILNSLKTGEEWANLDRLLRLSVLLWPRLDKEHRFFVNNLPIISDIVNYSFSETFSDNKENNELYCRFIKIIMECGYADCCTSSIKDYIKNGMVKINTPVSKNLTKIFISGLSQFEFNKLNLCQCIIDDLDHGTSELEIENDLSFYFFYELKYLIELAGKSVHHFTEEEQKILTRKIINFLPFTNKIHKKSKSLFVNMTYLLTKLLNQLHGKFVLDEKMKNKIIQFFAFWENRFDDYTASYSTWHGILRKINLGNPTRFYLTDIIIAADLEFTQNDSNLLSLVIHDYGKLPNKHLFTKKLKEFYCSQYLKKWKEYSDDNKSLDNLLELTNHFNAALSKNEHSLALDILIKEWQEYGIAIKSFGKSILCLHASPHKINENHITQIKKLTLSDVEKFYTILTGNANMLIQLMELTKIDPFKKYCFTDDDLSKFSDKMIDYYALGARKPEKHQLRKSLIKSFIQIIKDENLISFASSVNRRFANDTGYRPVDKVIFHWLIQEFEKRSMPDQVGPLKKIITDHINDENKRNHLPLLVLEKSYDVTEMISAFLLHFSCFDGKNISTYESYKFDNYSANLLSRMNESELINLRDSVLKILRANTLLRSNTLDDDPYYSITYQLDGLILLLIEVARSLNDEFDYLNFLVSLNANFLASSENQADPLSPCRLSIIGLICHQLLIKNKTLPDIAPSKKSILFDLTKWMDAKATLIKTELAAAPKNAPK